MASFLRLQHAASGGDIDAAALTEGAGESCVAEDFLKLHAGGASGAGESAGGIERNEIDVGIDAFEEIGESSCRFGRIIFAGDEGPLEEDTFAGGAAVVAAGVDERFQVPAFTGGYKRGAFVFGRSVEAHREAVGPIFRGHAQNAWHDTYCADGDFRRTDVDAADIGDRGERVMDRIDVVKRFAHAHHHQIAKAGFGVHFMQHAFRVEDLGDDFSGAEVPHETHLPGRTENAAHRAAGLGADADRVACVVTHQHRFNDLTIVEAQEKFAREAIAAEDFAIERGLIEKKLFAFAD